MKRRKVTKPLGNFYPTKEYYNAFSWCTRNGIKIFPLKRKLGYILVYEIDGKRKSTFKEHDESYYQMAIWQFYLYLYKKYKDVRDKNLPANGGLLRS